MAMFIPDQSRQQAVFDRLRQGILAGTLPSGGSPLPPTRALAEENWARLARRSFWPMSAWPSEGGRARSDR